MSLSTVIASGVDDAGDDDCPEWATLADTEFGDEDTVHICGNERGHNDPHSCGKCGASWSAALATKHG